MAQVFQEEELYGLKLAAAMRTLVIGAPGAFVVVFANPANMLYWTVAAVFSIFLAWLHFYVRTRWSKQRGLSYVFVALDFISVCVFAMRPEFLAVNEIPIQATDKFSVQSIILALIAMYGLTGRPNLVIWAGAAAALSWGASMAYLLSLPDTLSNSDRAWAGIAIMLDPHYIGLGRSLIEMVIFMMLAGTIAVIVIRLRGLVAKRAIVERERTNLSRYLPRDLADTLAERDNPLDAPKVHRVVVSFVDMVGFTSRAEALAPGETIELLRDFHGVLSDCAFEHRGTLEKFLGDGIMVTFGRVEPDPGDATAALSCAIDMVERIDRWTKERGDAPPIQIGIGLHVGEVVIGNIGTKSRLEPAILGDVVNTASRIQSLTRKFGYPLLFSDDLLRAAEAAGDGQAHLSRAEPLGPQPIRGRGGQLNLYGLRVEPSITRAG